MNPLLLVAGARSRVKLIPVNVVLATVTGVEEAELFTSSHHSTR
jgi:hypothetical protein